MMFLTSPEVLTEITILGVIAERPPEAVMFHEPRSDTEVGSQEDIQLSDDSSE